MNKKQITSVGIIVILLLSLFAGILPFTQIEVVQASPSWWDSSWANKREIKINNTGGGALTYYQVYVDLTSTPLNATSIRVVNETADATVPHWCENVTGGDCYALWFNATSISASSWLNSTYYIYYTNPSASSTSDGDVTFEFFDDFLGEETTVYNYTRLADMPQAGQALNKYVPYVNGKCYIFGPQTSAGDTTLLWIYDNATDTWDTGANVPQALYGWNVVESILDSDKIYLIGGGPGDNRILYRYNIAADNYTTLASSTNRHSEGAPMVIYNITGYKDRIYILCGGAYSSENYQDYYNITPNTWHTDPADWTAGDGLESSAYMVYNDKMFSLGGRKATVAPNIYIYETAHYNLTTDTWYNETAHNSSQYRVVNPYWGIIDNKLHIFGGGTTDGSTYTIKDQHWVYNPADDSWENLSSVSPLPVVRWNGGSATLPDGTIIIFGGTDTLMPSGRTPEVWKYKVGLEYTYMESELNTTKWTATESDNVDITNSICEITATSYNEVYTNVAYGINHIVEHRGKFSADGAANSGFAGGLYGRPSGTSEIDMRTYNGVGKRFLTMKEGSSQWLTRTTDATSYHIWGFSRFDVSRFYVDYVQENSGLAANTPTIDLAMGFFTQNWGGGPYTVYVDWSRVRKYASPEPDASLGSEESPAATTPSISNVTTGSISATSQWVAWDVNQTAHNRWKYSLYENMSSPSWSSWQNSTNAPNITVATLSPETKYYYQAWSCNTTNTSLTDNSTTANFTTPAALPTAPSISSLTNTTPTYNSVFITWTTNQSDSNNRVKYGKQSNLSDGTWSSWDNNTASVNISLSSLDCNTKYYYQAGAYNGTDASYNSSEPAAEPYKNFTTAACPYNYIYTGANEWCLFNNWSSTSETFEQTAANESNDLAYSHYNSTSGLWESYWVGYDINKDTVIDKHESVMGYFDAATTITCSVPTAESISIPATAWYYSYLRESTSHTLSEIKTSMIACDIYEIYAFDNSTQDYTNTASYTVDPNEGFSVYANASCTWDGGV